MSFRDVPIPHDSQRALEGIALLKKKWSPVVLLLLQHRGPQGFNELLDQIPDISSKALSETLTLLQEKGVIDRHVVNESPLRVKYERTAAGRELEPIFESVGSWVDEHLDRPKRIVLLADGDHRLTELYQGWIPDRYTTYRAHDWDEVTTRLKQGVDIVLLDVDTPGVDIQSVVSDRSYRTVLVVGDQPAPAELTVECDDVRRKPLLRRTALDAVNTQFERIGESPQERKRASLAARISFLESIYSAIRLEDKDVYRVLVDRLETLDEST